MVILSAVLPLNFVHFTCFFLGAYEIEFVILGVARGCGWQQLAMYVNLATFYFIGVTIACLLGFKLKLYAKVRQPFSC